MRALILSGLILAAWPSLAAEKNFQCRGDYKNSDQIFRYSLVVDGKNTRSRLTVHKGDRQTKDFGWKKYVSQSGKIVVDSPWSKYRAYLVPDSTVYVLALVNPANEVQVDDVPFSRFYCVKFLP